MKGYTSFPDDPHHTRPWSFPLPWPLINLGGLTLSTGALSGQLGYLSLDDDGLWPPQQELIKDQLSDSLTNLDDSQ